MANQKMFSIFDTQAKCFRSPFFALTTGLAIRMFTDEVNRPESEINRHATDFYLFYVGDFEDGDGAITAQLPAVKLTSAQECLQDGPAVSQNPGGSA